MGYLEKLAATTTNEKSKEKNEKEMATLQTKLEKAKRALHGASKFADKTRETKRNADAAIKTADATTSNKSKTNDDLYKEAKSRMTDDVENEKTQGDQADKLLAIKRAMEENIKAEKARKRKEAEERAAAERIEKARAQADEAKVLKASLMARIKHWETTLANSVDPRDKYTAEKILKNLKKKQGSNVAAEKKAAMDLLKVQIEEKRKKAAAAAKRYKEEQEKKKAEAKRKLEELAKEKLRAMAAKAAKEKTARDEMAKKAKASADLVQKKKYLIQQLEAATLEADKARYSEQIAELDGELMGANLDNAEATAKIKKLDAAKAKAAKAEKAKIAKAKKIAAAKLKEREAELEKLAGAMQADVKR